LREKTLASQRTWRSAYRLQEAGLVLVIVLLAALLTFGGGSVTVGGREVNNFLRVDNLVPNVATTMSWIALMAVGATIVIAGGGIDISVGSIFGLAALGTAAVLQGFAEDASAWLVIPVAAAVALGIGLLCGLINGAIVVGLRMHPFIVTLGTLTIFRGLALISVPTKSLPAGDRSLPLALTSRFVSWQLLLERADAAPLLIQPVPMLIMLAWVLAAWVFLSHTVGGRQVYAVGGNEEAARFSGIATSHVKLRMNALSGLSGGLAGLVSTGFYGSANTATGEGYELMVIAAAVVGGASLTGGRGTALGALLGALVIKLIDNGTYILKQINLGFATLPVSKEYSKIMIGVAIILAVAVDRFSEYVQSRHAATWARPKD
jgi:ribose/xylose/arabinose/galactoside ABC-type transport system permease subunit